MTTESTPRPCRRRVGCSSHSVSPISTQQSTSTRTSSAWGRASGARDTPTFAIESPPLELVLTEDERGGTLNHLGVDVPDSGAVDAAAATFVHGGLITDESQGVECCYATQDMVFVTDPDGAEWEWYTVLEGSPIMTPETTSCC